MMNLYLYLCIVILIALAVIDFKTFMLPNYLTYPFILSGLAINLFSSARLCSPTESMIGAIIGFVTLWLCNKAYYLYAKKDGIGMGDAKLLAGLGANFGWLWVFPSLLLASILGLIGGLIWLRMKGLSTTEAFPFGPYICLVGILWIVDYLFKLRLFTTLFL